MRLGILKSFKMFERDSIVHSINDNMAQFVKIPDIDICVLIIFLLNLLLLLVHLCKLCLSIGGYTLRKDVFINIFKKHTKLVDVVFKLQPLV